MCIKLELDGDREFMQNIFIFTLWLKFWYNVLNCIELTETEDVIRYYY
jgi:hypothetical protein